MSGRCERRRMIYVWVLLAAAALVFVVWLGLIGVWAFLLRRLARSGIDLDHLVEPEDAEPAPSDERITRRLRSESDPADTATHASP